LITVRIELLPQEQVGDALGGLAELLIDSVDDGASVGFLTPLTRDDAERWWADLLDSPEIRAWLALDEEGAVVGSVLLAVATPDNGRHRAEVKKLLVHRRARRRGLATQLMTTVEEDARAQGRTLLMLDTETGSPAETLYRGLGWSVYGVVPDHAALPDGRLAPTTFMFKELT
jgi:GNAT superfamily N-acetyltransferase